MQKCDVLVTAVERVIDAPMAAKLQCRVLAEAANGPTTPDADEVLDQRRKDIFVIPDILCNSGGVVVSYFEWVQDLQQFFWDEKEVMTKLYHVLDRAFVQVMKRVEQDGVSHRTAAMAIGVEKVRSAVRTRAASSPMNIIHAQPVAQHSRHLARLRERSPERSKAGREGRFFSC